MTGAYVDASALTKLVLDEPNARAMRRWWIESERAYCSRIGIVETSRAVRRWVGERAELESVFRSIDIVEIDSSIARHAAVLGPHALRSLDAIHLASALAIGAEIDAFVTYDDRLADAARDLGLPVVRPA